MNKQKLQEQIDTMREELAKMETELAECGKVKLDGGTQWSWYKDGELIAPMYRECTREAVKAGATRATKELAEIASRNMVTRNKLEAYAMQLEPEWRDIIGKTAYTLYYNGKEYKIDNHTTCRFIGCVYMSKSAAEQICEWLNDGRIEL